MNYEQENAFLALYGFHLAYDAEDSAEEPKDFDAEGEVWQLGSDDDIAEVRYFTRAEALRYVKERRQEGLDG